MTCLHCVTFDLSLLCLCVECATVLWYECLCICVLCCHSVHSGKFHWCVTESLSLVLWFLLSVMCLLLWVDVALTVLQQCLWYKCWCCVKFDVSLSHWVWCCGFCWVWCVFSGCGTYHTAAVFVMWEWQQWTAVFFHSSLATLSLFISFLWWVYFIAVPFSDDFVLVSLNELLFCFIHQWQLFHFLSPSSGGFTCCFILQWLFIVVNSIDVSLSDWVWCCGFCWVWCVFC
jgi:hypothetical protein